MKLHLYLSLSLLALALPARAEFGYGTDDIPNSSIYQMLYRPKVKQDVPFTSLYSEIDDEVVESDLDLDEDFEPVTSSLDNLRNLYEFKTDLASDYKVKSDFFGTEKWTGDLGRRKEKTLRCGKGYVSERLDPDTLTIVRTCAGLENGELNLTGNNAFLGNSTDSTLQQYSDANSFVQAVKDESRRMEKLRAAAMMNPGASDQAAKLGLLLSEDMIALLEQFAASTPGLREVIDEAIATGNMRMIYHRVLEAGGLDALKNQPGNFPTGLENNSGGIPTPYDF